MATGDDGGDLTGRLLAGRYRVTGTLGRGGMGVVCRATDEVLGREVAVKILHASVNPSAPEWTDVSSRMRREARAAVRIRHAGVVTVHDVTEEDGRPLIVMELVDGSSLDDVLGREGALDPIRAAAIGAGVAEALDAAHRAGVLHRDVKPGNVLLERGGRVVLTDFGIASIQETEAEAKLTRAGELVGSLDYLPPERAQGEEPGPASDIWSLGMTLYAAVEGSAPFHRSSVWPTLNAIVTEELPPPRRAGPLAPVLHEMLRKDPARRPSAARAGQLLRAVAPGSPAVAPTAGAADVPYVPPAPAPASGAGFRQPPTNPMPADRARSPYQPAPLAARHQPPAAPDRPPSESRGRRRGVLAGAVAAVLLVGGGVAYALAGGPGGHTGAAGGGHPAGPGLPAFGSAPASVPPSASPSRTAPARHTAAPTTARPATHRPAPAPTTAHPAPPKPVAPSCAGIGGGKYDCHVWRQADSISSSGAHEGILKAGTDYFYCQANLGRRETYGSWTNVWWAKTDDDSGNTGVYVSDVYLSGGENDQPVPGLPVC